MIRVVIFMDRLGVQPMEDWTVLGRIDIANDLETSLANQRRGSYKCEIYKKKPQVWKRTKLRDFPRASYHPWEMVRRILNQVAEQNGGKI